MEELIVVAVRVHGVAHGVVLWVSMDNHSRSSDKPPATASRSGLPRIKLAVSPQHSTPGCPPPDTYPSEWDRRKTLVFAGNSQAADDGRVGDLPCLWGGQGNVSGAWGLLQ